MEDLEKIVGFIRLTAHQLVSAKPTVGVCLPAQKSYKSEQIEQIRQIIIFRLQISKRNHLIFQFQFNNENNKHY